MKELNEEREVEMPDSIAQIALNARNTQAIRDKMPPPPVTAHPMPGTNQEYDTIF